MRPSAQNARNVAGNGSSNTRGTSAAATPAAVAQAQTAEGTARPNTDTGHAGGVSGSVPGMTPAPMSLLDAQLTDQFAQQEQIVDDVSASGACVLAAQLVMICPTV